MNINNTTPPPIVSTVSFYSGIMSMFFFLALFLKLLPGAIFVDAISYF